MNHIYENEIQKLHNQLSMMKQKQTGDIISRLKPQENSSDTLLHAITNLVSNGLTMITEKLGGAATL